MSSRKRSSSSTQDDLFNPEVSLLLPPRLAVDGKVLGSPVRQLAVPALRVSCRLQSFSIRRVNGYEVTLVSGGTLKIISTKTATQLEADLVLLVPGATEPSKIAEALELGEGRWVNIVPANIGALDTRVRGGLLAAVTSSWQEAFHLREGRSADNGVSAKPGLRRPQIGALHAALAHATRSTEPATIVMPTGTGKTEVALAAMAEASLATLVVAPVRDLMYQWHRRILAGLGYDAGSIGDSLFRVRPVSVTTYDSACIHMERLGNQFGLIVFDECHHLPG